AALSTGRSPARALPPEPIAELGFGQGVRLGAARSLSACGLKRAVPAPPDAEVRPSCCCHCPVISILRRWLPEASVGIGSKPSKGGTMVPSIQTIYAIAFCAAGALTLAAARYQVKHYQIGKVQLISPRANHTIGLVCLVIGVLIFSGQFFTRHH